MCVEIRVRVPDVPVGRHKINASILRFPEGGERVAKIRVVFDPQFNETDERRILGTLAVDSAKVILIDEEVYRRDWKTVGTERIGQTEAPQGHKQVANLLSKKFGLKWKQVDFLRAQCVEPVSEELEQEIIAYLKTHSEYAAFPFLYFSVYTRNSEDRITEAMEDRNWSQVVLDDASGADLFAVTSGYGDGGYDVVGLFREDKLVSLEVEFIGPPQDEILEAFPILRQGRNSRPSILAFFHQIKSKILGWFTNTAKSPEGKVES